jgi:hypothetical protein
MDKKELSFLQETANKVYDEVTKTIKDLTKENPLEVFSKEDTEADDFQDRVYEHPYGYFVSKHGFYVQGAVQKVQGNDAILFLTGEDWGDDYTVDVSELPFESQISLLTNLIERS